MENLTGKQFGPYQIVAPLGEGGMAAVYKAYQPGMERYVALKVLPRPLANAPEFLARFQREAKLLAQLQHPHILSVFDYGQADGYTYIVMPFVQSGALNASLTGQPTPLPRLAQIISQVGDALHYAHLRGLVHRDIKPGNILVDESGNCLLTDFGLARMLETADHLTTTGTVLGTPAYMSPEQGSGQAADARSDIYSLGIILYELATGRVPYQAETPIAVMIKHIQDPLPPAKTFNPALPEAVERVILKALSKRPADRYATAGEMVYALQAALPAALPPAATTRTPQAAPVPVSRPGSVTHAKKFPLGLVLGCVGLLFLLMGGGLLLTLVQAMTFTSQQSSPPTSTALALNVSSTPVTALNGLGVPLPPAVAGNVRSAKASYGCGILLGSATEPAQLSVCGTLPNLPAEWVTKAQRVSVDCATLASDRIIVELWTGADYTGDTWGYTFGCPTPAPPPTAAGGACFADVVAPNRVVVALETARQTAQRFTLAQPPENVFAIQFMRDDNFVGGVKLKPLASRLGFDVLAVVDSACTPLTTYENISRPSQPPNAPYAYDTLHYHFGAQVIAMEIFYKADGPLELRAEPVVP